MLPSHHRWGPTRDSLLGAGVIGTEKSVQIADPGSAHKGRVVELPRDWQGPSSKKEPTVPPEPSKIVR